MMDKLREENERLKADGWAAELSARCYHQEHARAMDWCRKAQTRRAELRHQQDGMAHRNAVIRKLEGRIEWFERELTHRDRALECHMEVIERLKQQPCPPDLVDAIAEAAHKAVVDYRGLVESALPAARDAARAYAAEHGVLLEPDPKTCSAECGACRRDNTNESLPWVYYRYRGYCLGLEDGQHCPDCGEELTP